VGYFYPDSEAEAVHLQLDFEWLKTFGFPKASKQGTENDRSVFLFLFSFRDKTSFLKSDCCPLGVWHLGGILLEQLIAHR
jgi:hypothetical protein